MVRCPVCKSGKVYQGYRKPSFILRFFRIHEFLCEYCNLQFQAFALREPRRKKRRQPGSHEEEFNRAINQPLDSPRVAQPRAVQQMAAATSQTGVGPVAASHQSERQETPQKAGALLNLSALPEQTPHHRSHRSRHVCPQCGSTDTERRRRRLWERIAFFFTDIRAYVCRICGASFYARRKYKSSR